MSSISSSTPATTTTNNTSSPWFAAQPALTTALVGAKDLYDKGLTPYSGPTQAGLSDQSKQALDQTQQIANGQGAVLGQAANDYAKGVLDTGGISSGQNAALGVLGNAANGGMQIDSSGYQGLLSRAMQPSASSSYLTDIASGKDLGTPNPFLMDALDAANRKTMDAVNGNFSAAGRYGSGAQTNVLSRNIGENNTNALMNDYEQARNRQLTAAGQIDSSNQGLLSAQLSGLSGLAGVQGSNIGTQLSSASGLSDALAAGQNRALSTALNGSTISGQLYDPAGRLAGVGQAYDDRAQNDLNAQIDLFNQQQQLPWQNLSQLNAIATGAGSLGGSTTGTQIKPGQSTLQQLLGYGTTSAGLLGGLLK